VCSKKSEDRLLKVWFKKGERDLEDYERSEHKGDIVEIETRFAVDGCVAT